MLDTQQTATTPYIMNNGAALTAEQARRGVSIYAPRMSGRLFTLFVFVGALGCAVLVEKYAPDDWKISHIAGTMVGRKEAAALEAYGQAKLQYEATLLQQQEIMQANIKGVELFNQLTMQAYEQLYRRENMYADALAKMTQQFHAAYTQVVNELERGNIKTVAMTDLFNNILGQHLWPEMEDQIREKNRKLKEQTLKDYQTGVQTFKPVHLPGWEKFATPDEFSALQTGVIEGFQKQLNSSRSELAEVRKMSPFQFRDYFQAKSRNAE